MSFDKFDKHSDRHHPRAERGDGPRRGRRGGPHGPRPEGSGPQGPGPEGFGPGRPGHRRGHGHRRPRGDVRTATLLLLAEEPMHGYQLMQTISDRSDGMWTPSPGAIYPTIAQLEDEGLVTVSAEGGRKLVKLTEAGEAHVAEHKDSWPNPFPGSDGVNLRDLVGQLMEATRQVGRTGTDAQRAEAAEVLATARRRMYLILAGEEKPAAESE